MARSIYTDDAARLAALLRSLRVEAGVSQVELADRLGRPQSFVSKYESGQRRLDLIELRSICQSLGTRLVDLVRWFERGA